MPRKMADNNHLYALVICGGAGTRLWPRSRRKTPKQFLENFFGKTTLFRQTIDRALLLTESNRIIIVTIGDYVDEIIKYAPEILPRNIIAEPIGRNTALAVGLGTAYIKKADPEAIVMTFWSDAAVTENESFAERLKLAAEAASKGNYLVTVGIKPTFAHTGLGYIETGNQLDQNTGEIYKVISFKEKPELKLAQEFLEKGNFYWNTGIFTCSVKSLWEAFGKYSPKLFNGLEKIYLALSGPAEQQTIKEIYESAEDLAIDNAVWEKADNLLLVPATFGWSDIGDWQVAYDLGEKDAEGNAVTIFGGKGKHFGLETKNCLIQAENRTIATIGLSDLVIIETEDTVLICPRQRAQEVKKIVTLLKEKEEKDLL